LVLLATVGWIQGFQQFFYDNVIKPIQDVLGAIWNGLQSIIRGVAQQVYNIIVRPLMWIGQAIEGIFSTVNDAIRSVLRNIFFVGVTFTLISPKVMVAQVSLPPIAYVVIGTLMCVAGLVLVVYTSEIPIVNIITTMIGWSLIMLGSMVAIYGVAPQQAMSIFLTAMIIIYVIGMFYIIYSAIKAVRG